MTTIEIIAIVLSIILTVSEIIINFKTILCFIFRKHPACGC
ncbi:hypothetical protein [Maribacter sp. 4G9]|nr:hypothetical protein [Maribacter sp. 4G9]